MEDYIIKMKNYVKLYVYCVLFSYFRFNYVNYVNGCCSGF